jgi:ketosteroid isomerase-like protein
VCSSDLDLEALLAVWEDSDAVACLLPMQPLVQGRAAVREVWQRLLAAGQQVEIEIHHRLWLDSGDMAIHAVEERVQLAQEPRPLPPMYATNVYRRGPAGWSLVLHQNSPAPPPPGMMGRPA